MSYDYHPLADVFNACDLQRLRNGICIESSGRADPDMAWLLTEAIEKGDPFALSLGDWYSLAAKHGENIKRYYRGKLRSSVDSRCAFMQWCGELMAGWFLERQLRVETKHLEELGKPIPDYRVRLANRDSFVEVKTLVGGLPAADFMGAVKSRAPLVRAAIKSAIKQFDKNKANLLLIVDYYRPPVLPNNVIDALFGDLMFKLLYDEEGPVGDLFAAREENIRFQPTINTRVGLVGTLFWNGEPNCCAHLFHNPHALLPIPPESLDPWPQFVPNRELGVMEWRNQTKAG